MFAVWAEPGEFDASLGAARGTAPPSPATPSHAPWQGSSSARSLMSPGARWADLTDSDDEVADDDSDVEDVVTPAGSPPADPFGAALGDDGPATADVGSWVHVEVGSGAGSGGVADAAHGTTFGFDVAPPARAAVTAAAVRAGGGGEARADAAFGSLAFAAASSASSSRAPVALASGLPHVDGFVPAESLISTNPANSRISLPVAAKRGADAGGPRGYASLLGDFGASVPDGAQRPPRLEAVLPATDERVRAPLRAAAHGLRAQQEPEAMRDGMGGTYVLRDPSGHPAAIFKPCDEEPLAPNNPKGWEGRAMGAPGYKPCVRVGEAALREVAAFLLDRGFAGVPPACLARCSHPALNYKVGLPLIESLVDMAALQRSPSALAAPGRSGPAPNIPEVASSAAAARVPSPGGLARALSTLSLAPSVAPPAPRAPKLGSLQAFVAHDGDASERAPSRFAADDIHRIGVLDIRILNCDRHLGNLLVAAPEPPDSAGAAPALRPWDGCGRLRLIPIDHGYALPEALVDPFFEWLFWPQAELPFSPAVRAAVAAFDFAADAALLRSSLPGLRDECLRCLEVTTTLLKMTVAAGLTLHEIGSIVTRSHHLGQPVLSDLEVMCADARAESLAASTPPSGLSSRSASIASPYPSCYHDLAVIGRRPSAPAAAPLSTLPAAVSASQSGGAATRVDRDDCATTGGLFPGDGASCEELTAVGVLDARSCCLTPGDSFGADMFGTGPATECGSPCMLAASALPPLTPGPVAAAAPFPAPPCEHPLGDSFEAGRAVSPAWAQRDGGDGLATPPRYGAPLRLPHALTAVAVRACDAPGLAGPDCRASLPPAWPPAGVTTPPGAIAPSIGVLTTTSNGGVGAGAGSHRAAIQRRAAWRMRGAPGGAARHPLGVHPDDANYVFTGLSESQWLVFMDRIREYVASELAQGTWRLRRAAPLAATAPAPARLYLPRSP